MHFQMDKFGQNNEDGFHQKLSDAFNILPIIANRMMFDGPSDWTSLLLAFINNSTLLGYFSKFTMVEIYSIFDDDDWPLPAKVRTASVTVKNNIGNRIQFCSTQFRSSNSSDILPHFILHRHRVGGASYPRYRRQGRIPIRHGCLWWLITYTMLSVMIMELNRNLIESNQIAKNNS